MTRAGSPQIATATSDPILFFGRILLWVLVLLFVASVGTADVIVVDEFTDAVVGSMGSCQLRDAIEAANTDTVVNGCTAGSGADIVEFAGSGFRETILVAELPDIIDDLEINGPGTDLLRLNGNFLYALFFFDNGVVGAVRGMTLFQGSFMPVSGGGACLHADGAESLIVEDVIVKDCSAGVNSAAVMLTDVAESELRRVSFLGNFGATTGGMLVHAGSVTTAEDILFSGNTSLGPASAGLFLRRSAMVTCIRCTFFDNEASEAPAIKVIDNASLALLHCTIQGNHVTSTDGSGAVQVSFGSLTLFNTILAGNVRDDGSGQNADIDDNLATSFTSHGHNLLGNSQGVETPFPAGMPNANLDLVGTNLALLDPELGDLLDNGGPQATLLPNPSSPVVDQGSCPGELADQRGYLNATTGMRPVDDAGVVDSDDGCDIGAVERGATEVPMFSDGFESGNTSQWS